jgi:hypothetical protein
MEKINLAENFLYSKNSGVPKLWRAEWTNGKVGKFKGPLSGTTMIMKMNCFMWSKEALIWN